MVKVDAFADATPAVNLYRKSGFRIEATFEDKEIHLNLPRTYFSNTDR